MNAYRRQIMCAVVTGVALLLLMGVLLLSGCASPEMRDTVMPVNDDWQQLYGDTPESQLFYNTALMIKVINAQGAAISELREAVNNHAGIINKNNAATGGATTQPASQPATQPRDVWLEWDDTEAVWRVSPRTTRPMEGAE